MAEAQATLVRFGRALRSEGVTVGTGQIAAFCEAASLLAGDDLYWAGRATLASSRGDVDLYDRVFRAFFGGERVPPGPAPRRPAAPTGEGRASRLDPRPGADEHAPELALASGVERLNHKPFSRCSEEELERLAAAMAEIRLAVPLRRSRRLDSARRGTPDLRRTLRHSFRTAGEPVERAWRAPRRRRRRLVLVVDVSGSMAPYSRALVMFAHAALRADARWEAFCFGTRLTRVTRALAATDVETALGRAAAEVVDWDGGTRIGESLKRFLDEFGHRGLTRGAVVAICSDGLDVGDPELLRAQMARLSRLAHRVVWLNPLKEDPRYEPLARGMRAALPHVDAFASAHDLASLEELARLLERLS